MGQTIITHGCPRCGSEKLAKNGHDYQGVQRYACRSCGRYRTLHTQSGYSASGWQQVKQGVLERVSLRGLERLLAITRRTVQRWLVGWVQAVPALATTLMPVEPDDGLERDERWSLVGGKAQLRWLWLALWHRARQVVAISWATHPVGLLPLSLLQ